MQTKAVIAMAMVFAIIKTIVILSLTLVNKIAMVMESVMLVIRLILVNSKVVIAITMVYVIIKIIVILLLTQVSKIVMVMASEMLVILMEEENVMVFRLLEVMEVLR